ASADNGTSASASSDRSVGSRYSEWLVRPSRWRSRTSRSDSRATLACSHEVSIARIFMGRYFTGSRTGGVSGSRIGSSALLRGVASLVGGFHRLAELAIERVALFPRQPLTLVSGKREIRTADEGLTKFRAPLVHRRRVRDDRVFAADLSD